MQDGWELLRKLRDKLTAITKAHGYYGNDKQELKELLVEVMEHEPENKDKRKS